MKVKDVTDTFEQVNSLRWAVENSVDEAVAGTCAASPALYESVNKLLRSTAGMWTRFRLLPLAVHAALTGKPEPAVPVAVLSRIWWTGAEVLDDIADDEFDSAAIGMNPAQATIAAIACTTLIPQAVIARAPVTADAARLWASEFITTSLTCAGGQADDLASDGQASWARTILSYAGKTGAPYERDTVMAVLLADQDRETVRAWRAFGRLFGVLRQLANDHADATPINMADLTNGVRTLLVSHVAESSEPDTAADAHLLLASNSVPQASIASYVGRVDAIVDQLSALLERLAPPSEYRDLIQWLINRSVAAVHAATATPVGTGLVS